MDINIKKPYLVIPKLIEQPTWGGTYIVKLKKWSNSHTMRNLKIGQSYELYDKSNLSTLNSSTDPAFTGEITDSRHVEEITAIPDSIQISRLIAADPVGVLGDKVLTKHGPTMPLLLKFTQALGNSFQLHIPDGTKHPRWKPKPESWYYFEPGLITCGVRSDASWDDYRASVTELDKKIQFLADQVHSGSMVYELAKDNINKFINQYNPWQYVNVVQVSSRALLDLSPCGIHHSWEENLASIPLGNVVYEIQLNVMDDVSTLRSFDKGKMSETGKLRPLQIEDYFQSADRSQTANDPKTHMRQSTRIRQTKHFLHERILATKYYSMDRVMMSSKNSEYCEAIETFRHIFVRSGEVYVVVANTTLIVSRGHSVFIPAKCSDYAIKSSVPQSEVLISYN